MAVLDEAQDRLFDAFPRRRGENLKAWFPRVSRELNAMARAAGWTDVSITPRRVRAIWNLEARRIDAAELRLIELKERVRHLETAAQRREGELNELRNRIDARSRGPLGGRGTPAEDGQQSTAKGSKGHRSGGEGTATEELLIALPTLKFSPRMRLH